MPAVDHRAPMARFSSLRLTSFDEPLYCLPLVESASCSVVVDASLNDLDSTLFLYSLVTMVPLLVEWYKEGQESYTFESLKHRTMELTSEQ